VERELDVLIVGSGVAGLAAAYEAASRGARCLVLEREDEVGGASVMSGAACCLVDTPLQRAAGIADSVDLAQADWAAMGGETADLRWAKRYLTASRPEVHDWLEALGIEWDSVAQPEGNSVPRWHLPRGWGRRIVEVLTNHLDRLGVPVMTGQRVERLLVDGDRVVGVEVSAVDSGAVDRNVFAGAVVLATGGFVADLDQVLEHAPHLRPLPRLLEGGAPTATGSGHAMLRDIGATFRHLENVWVYPTGTPDPQDPKGRRGLGLRGVTTELWLNKDGRRFHDESLRGGNAGTNALLAQPDSTCWCVFSAGELGNVLLIDNEYYGTPAGPDPEGMRKFWAESHYVWRADDAAGLASAIGLPVESVVSSINEFNAAIRECRATDPTTGRTMSGLAEVAGPLVAVQLFPMAQKNFGGVATDEDCAVVTGAGSRIDALYAAGEVAGMAGGSINGKAALEGTMFGPCVWSGRLAGTTAAEYAGEAAAHTNAQAIRSYEHASTVTGPASDDQPRPSVPDYSGAAPGAPDTATISNLDVLEEWAASAWPGPVSAMIQLGAGTSSTVRSNSTAWTDWAVCARVLRDVSSVRSDTTVLGHHVSSPIFVAPSGLHTMVRTGGEVLTAQGAKEADTVIVLSSATGRTVEDVCAVGAKTWFQFYWGRDRGRVRDNLQRAVASGCSAVVLTVDLPTPPTLDGRMRAAVSRLPGPPPQHVLPRDAHLGGEWDHDARLTWTDLEWLRSVVDVPIVLKGVTAADDALAAAAAGVDAVIVSNHGGRAIDHGVPTAWALVDVAAALKSESDSGRPCPELLVDGGIRRGRDILVALALGAKAVLIGRPTLWALAAHGADGVRDVLAVLAQQLRTEMALAGHADLESIDASTIRPLRAP
jgi:isopentenyl diphosphate isomerase/L-lactate dehydrogenase-like FMN-dependent dehydrogenase/predicted oxidoreductase